MYHEAMVKSSFRLPALTGRTFARFSAAARHVLLIGETGSGKSTLINILVNYFLGGSLSMDDFGLKVVIPTQYLQPTETGFSSSEQNVGDSTTSKTNSCHQYKFGSICFIDTPGLSDTRGINQDDTNIDKILEAASGVEALSAIIIVINGSVARMTTNLRNVIVRLRGNLPDAILDNILVVFTNCMEHTRNFDIRSLEFKPRAVFHMNNTAFSTNPNRWTERVVRSLTNDWTMSMEEVSLIINQIDSMCATATTAFKDMKKYRFEIKQMLHEARLKITELQQLHDELELSEVMLAKFANDKMQFKNYVQTTTTTVHSLKPAQYHSTICSTCNFVCHDHCGLDEISGKGDNAFKGCAAMNNDTCTTCPNKCHFSVHYHGRYTMVTEEKTLEQVLEDMKTKHDAADQSHRGELAKISTAKDAKDTVQRCIAQASADVLATCRNLQKICSGFNFVDELCIMLRQLEQQARLLASRQARDEADKFIRSLQRMCDEMAKTQPPTKPSWTDSDATATTSNDDHELRLGDNGVRWQALSQLQSQSRFRSPRSRRHRDGDQFKLQVPGSVEVEQAFKFSTHDDDDDDDDNDDGGSGGGGGGGDEPSHLPHPQVASVRVTKNRRSQAQHSHEASASTARRSTSSSANPSVSASTHSHGSGDRRARERKSQIPTQSSSTRSQVWYDDHIDHAIRVTGTLASQPRQSEPERRDFAGAGHRDFGYASAHPHALTHDGDDDDDDDDSNGDGVRMECKICRGMFAITEAHLQWLCSKKLAIPSSCPDCSQRQCPS